MSVAFSILILSGIVVTLFLLNEIEEDSVDQRKLDFVRVLNWIYVALIAMSMGAAIYSSPYVDMYRKRSRDGIGYSHVAGLDAPHQIV